MLSSYSPFLAEIERFQKVYAKPLPPPFLTEKKVKMGGLSMKYGS